MSFSIALNLVTEKFKQGAKGAEAAFGRLKSSVLGFAAALGAGSMGLKSFIDTAAGFEASVSKLSAILGTTPEKLKALTDDAKRLGEATKYTAAEASNLQIELAKLGFSRDEILKSTEAVLKFAQATDAGLAEAAALAGASLRMFGAEASESARYTSAMAVATTKSALSFTYLQTAMPIVGPVAKAFNFTIEDTLALLGKLADAGFDASSAATATRNILLNLADSGGALAQALGGSVKTLPEVVDGLQRLKAQGVDLNTTLELTDKRSVAAFNAFLSSADSINALRDSITGVEADLEQMAATMNDNIQGDMATLSSAWEALMLKFSESTNGPLRSGLAQLTAFIRTLKDNVAGLVAFVSTLVGGKMLLIFVGFWKKLLALQESAVNTHKAAQEQKQQATLKRTQAEAYYEQVKTAHETVENGKRLASDKQLNKAKQALDRARTAEENAHRVARVAAERAAAMQATSTWGRVTNNLTLISAKAAAAIRTVWATAGPMALLALAGAIVAKLVSMHTEAQRIKNMVKDFRKEAQNTTFSDEAEQLKTLQKLHNEAAQGSSEQEKIRAKIANLLGQEIQSQEDINQKIKDRIALLEAEAKVRYYTQKKIEAQARHKEITDKEAEQAKAKGYELQGNQYVKKQGKSTDQKQEDALVNAAMANAKRQGATVDEKTVRQLLGRPQPLYHSERTTHTANQPQVIKIGESAEAKALLKIIHESTDEIENATALVVQKGSAQTSEKVRSNNRSVTSELSPKDSELEKLKAEHLKDLARLSEQLKIGDISQEHYNQALNDLTLKSYLQAALSTDRQVAESDYLRGLKEQAQAIIKERDKTKALAELGQVQRNYNKDVQAARALFAKGFITQRELDDKLAALAVEAAQAATQIQHIGDGADTFVAAMQTAAKTLTAPAKLKSRDTTFDYKKSETDILGENLEHAKAYAKELQDQARKIGQSLDESLAEAMAGVPSLEEALKIAQVRQDVRQLSKDLNTGIYSGVKDIAASSDRLVKAFESMGKAMGDSEASTWERVLAVWNAMTNTVDSLLSIAETIRKLTELTEKLGKAKQVEAAIDTAATTTKITNATSGAATVVSTTATEVAAASTKVAANTAEGTSAAVKGAAQLPFPYNLVAMGGALAAALALFASIPKFATGGIVGGASTTGDRVLARVNSGEMILNHGQQSRLFRAINSGNLGGGQRAGITIGFDRVRGDSIYLSLKNYLKRTGKKL